MVALLAPDYSLPVLLLSLLAACAPTDSPLDPDDAVDSRCISNDSWISCAYESTTLHTDYIRDTRRDVHWQIPLGEPPATGWPTVILFQGSLYSGELSWNAQIDGPWGMWNQGLTVWTLLDAGYAVLAPEAHLDGDTWWDTNVMLVKRAWERTPDHALMVTLFESVADGTFGPLDPDRLYATGISSGGYMTSRMAVEYAERFQALAIQSGSYATCSGRLCNVGRLKDDHPPTLFLHGERDRVVPRRTMSRYADKLQDQGTDVRVVIDDDARHGWIDAAPDAILAWFDCYE